MEFFFLILFAVGFFYLLFKRIGQNDVVDKRDIFEAQTDLNSPEKLPPLKLPERFPVVRSRRPIERRIKKPDTKCLSDANLRRFSGKAYVTDGDGLRIKKEEIRLFGVDAPEFGHPHGKKAKWTLFALTKGQIVRAEVTGEDDHGRTVARCYLPDGRDLSAEMVKEGLALDWPKFSGGIYKEHEPDGVRKKLWLADARQKGRMHVWDAYEMKKNRSAQPRD